MKRSRDDDDIHKSPQLKLPLISETTRQPHMLDRGSTQKLTTSDALTYLKNVKDMFQDNKGKYDEFLEIMKDFKAQRMDTIGVIAKVKELFKGHQELILGFNTFLPRGFKITLPQEDGQHRVKKPVEFVEAIQFVNKIKMRFQGQDHVYKYFLDILSRYKKENKSISEVHREVAAVLHDQQDLLKEFTDFLPNSSATASNPYVQSSKDHNPCHDDRSSPMVTMGPLNSEKKVIISHECEVTRDVPGLDHEKECIRADKERSMHSEKDKERREDTEHREHHPVDRDFDNEVMCSFTQCKTALTLEDSVAELFHQDMHGQMLRLHEKVKEKLRKPDDYQAFLKCIMNYRTENITRSQLQSLVNNLLGAYPDLVGEVNKFIDRSEKTGCLQSDGHVTGSPQVEDGVRNRDHDGDGRDRDCEIIERDRLAIESKDISGSKSSILLSKDKYQAKPIQELDLSNCESCTPSYRLLPKNYPIPSASQRTKIGAEVLNDHWVSVTSGSEDYSFKHMRKNQYEESLFRCEDDRFELDMLLESVNVTAKRVEELLDRINNNSIKTDSLIHIEDFTALNLRCIERLYGDHGLDVMEVLRKNASLALPVILTRLKQKQEEWVRCRSDTNKVWAEIYAKNYHKSLDHRSFYFKQQDSKSLSTKALLAEIKEICEAREDDIQQYIAPRRSQNAAPDHKFMYSDLEVHEDLYQLMKYSIAQNCSPEQVDKVMKIWTTFVEHMLGVLRPSANSKGVAKTSDCAAKSDGNVLNHTSGFGKQIITNGQIVCPNATVATGPEKTHERLGGEPLGLCINSAKSGKASLEGGLESGARKILSLPKGGDCTKLVSSSNGAAAGGGRTERHHNETGCHLKIEREEGELSPNGDSEEDNFAAYRDHGLDSMHKLKDTSVSKENYRNRHHDGGFEYDNKRRFENTGVSQSENESGVERAVDNHGFYGDGTLVKPLTLYVPPSMHTTENRSRVFYGNEDFYIFFRLHQILYSRLKEAKEKSANDTWRGSNDTTPNDSYARFLELLYSFLDGAVDAAKYEDECRTVLGTWSFPVFTLDKLIDKLIKHLLAIATDEVNNKLLDLYAYESLRKPRRFVEELYIANASVIVSDSKIIRFECSFIPETDRHTCFTIQMINFGYEKSEAPAFLTDPNFAPYLSRQFLSVFPARKRNMIFLKRNKRKYACEDEGLAMAHAMERVRIANGLEFKMTAFTYKVYYVMGTSDSMVRMNRKKARSRFTPSHDINGQLKVQKFRRLLLSRIQPMAP